ncbi:hypothetical protein L6164_011761 [Bauhinia variegata]|uniref:Uncharacterized protein n=1 Tax=Bauhinia variegata TaxID=167791 RepID=A0ACB9P8A2_BAUVA|nr:hypothetical protein L6164_011761 [Bauhinia variegata]
MSATGVHCRSKHRTPRPPWLRTNLDLELQLRQLLRISNSKRPGNFCNRRIVAVEQRQSFFCIIVRLKVHYPFVLLQFRIALYVL